MLFFHINSIGERIQLSFSGKIADLEKEITDEAKHKFLMVVHS